MKKLKLKLEKFEATPLTKREMLKVLGGQNMNSTIDPSHSSFPQYSYSITTSSEVETSQEV